MSRLRNLGHALRYLRILSGRKQFEVAEVAGITRAMLSAYERGSREPSLTTLTKILDALGVDFAGLQTAFDRVESGSGKPETTLAGSASFPRGPASDGRHFDPTHPAELARFVGESEALPTEEAVAYGEMVRGFLAWMRAVHRAQRELQDRARRRGS
jgi:transcriptional regulator with XRE-family HTH domain